MSLCDPRYVANIYRSKVFAETSISSLSDPRYEANIYKSKVFEERGETHSLIRIMASST
jgi:hypothetical protein